MTTSTTPRPAPPRVLLYHDGRAAEVDGSPLVLGRLVALCEAALATSKGMLKIVVTPESIAAIKAHETAIELVYPATPPARAFDRLLIPLTGGLAMSGGQKFTAVFAGVGAYERPPVSNDADAGDRIRRALREMGEPVPE